MSYDIKPLPFIKTLYGKNMMFTYVLTYCLLKVQMPTSIMSKNDSVLYISQKGKKWNFNIFFSYQTLHIPISIYLGHIYETIVTLTQCSNQRKPCMYRKEFHSFVAQIQQQGPKKNANLHHFKKYIFKNTRYILHI